MSEAPQEHIWEKVTEIKPGAVSPTLSKSYGYEIPSPLILIQGEQCVSEAHSAELEDSTSALNEPECERSGNAKRTSTGDECSPDTGPTSNDGTTFEAWHENQNGDLSCQGPIAAALGANRSHNFQWISSAAVSPAKTSPSPADAKDSKATAPASSTSTPESQMSFAQDGSWSKTSQGFSPLPMAETLPSFSAPWRTSGMASHGGYLTLDTSEFPSDAVECSLSDILEATPHQRYSLSARAAKGILRRAAARGRTLPSELQTALESLSISEVGMEGHKPNSTASQAFERPTADQAEATLRQLSGDPTATEG
jgi:hypothetical protein